MVNHLNILPCNQINLWPMSCLKWETMPKVEIFKYAKTIQLLLKKEVLPNDSYHHKITLKAK